jgi:small subunit ribosomal protein S16
LEAVLAAKIRLRRTGSRNHPSYRLVVADSRAKRDGRFVESIGYYNPLHNPAVVEVDEERALYWLKQGAQPTETVRSMLVKKGVWKKFTSKESA